ncbi:PREDICTED: uncharacterized protein LOC109341068 [Lupinus angustifolius]|uniref:uncharacterized protein LOC109341068 n=1 Tax=Lupinus angustifolius TaxID=3871 RepID=UPI00092F9D73|nr:PREDICTED: uncharacterized protein LOC109341068 [Lupinus angustifolius]
MTTSNGFSTNLPILDGKNFDHWSIQMKAIFGFQDCLDVVQQGVQELDENSTEEEKVELKEAKKRDCKAIFLIHQCVDHSNFERISAATSSKEAWQILDKCYSGGVKVKKVRLQMMRRQYELLQMEEQESIADYFTRIRTLINVMKGCGEKLSEQSVVEKILRTLSAKFDHVVVAIEESKDLDNFKIDELQGSLEAHEQRFLERMSDRQSQQALSVQFKKKKSLQHFDRFNKESNKWHSGRKFDDENTILEEDIQETIPLT